MALVCCLYDAVQAGSNILPADVENSLHELTGLEAYLVSYRISLRVT